MHGVNLDLLRTMQHHSDGRPKDPHARHWAEHRALLRAERRARWSARFQRLILTLISPRPAPSLPDPVLPVGSNIQNP